MRPRYFTPEKGSRPLFWDWPLYRSGKWSPLHIIPDEPEMTEEEAQQNEQDSHTHP